MGGRGRPHLHEPGEGERRPREGHHGPGLHGRPPHRCARPLDHPGPHGERPDCDARRDQAPDHRFLRHEEGLQRAERGRGPDLREQRAARRRAPEAARDCAQGVQGGQVQGADRDGRGRPRAGYARGPGRADPPAPGGDLGQARRGDLRAPLGAHGARRPQGHLRHPLHPAPPRLPPGDREGGQEPVRVAGRAAARGHRLGQLRLGPGRHRGLQRRGLPLLPGGGRPAPPGHGRRGGAVRLPGRHHGHYPPAQAALPALQLGRVHYLQVHWGPPNRHQRLRLWGPAQGL
mmetsp:Transcript_39656/g.58315  ORF Transcript_39656/g.58315 Transcript_39656/m.58315 type:complete len:289 (+) Transcript_39656:96-962(+)